MKFIAWVLSICFSFFLLLPFNMTLSADIWNWFVVPLTGFKTATALSIAGLGCYASLTLSSLLLRTEGLDTLIREANGNEKLDGLTKYWINAISGTLFCCIVWCFGWLVKYHPGAFPLMS